MKKFLILFSAAVVVSVLFFTGVLSNEDSVVTEPMDAEGIELVVNGGSDYSIVVGEDAIAAEKTAAVELQRFIEEVGGVALPICSSTTGNGIYVGPSGFLDVDYGQLRPDEIIIKSQNKNLFLSGARPRGSLYAVYTFLEDYIGIRWWTADVSHIPTLENITIPQLDVQYAPPFAVREAFYSGVVYGKPPFAARSRFNGHFENIPDSYGGHVKTVGWCHTFEKIISKERYFAEYPDWFALVKNKRTAAQLCLTNPQMRTTLVENLKQWVKDNPGQKIYSVTQNDNYKFCRCPDCEKAVEQLGSQTDLMLAFVNSVAEDVAQEYPDVKIETLAYQWTAPPPETVKPALNVIILFCLRTDISKSLAASENREDLDYLQGWAEVTDSIRIWDYVANFSNHLLPHPTLRHMAGNIRIFADNKPFSIFFQGDNDAGANGDFVQLRAWLLGKLLWNPDLDEKELIDEFLEGYYGSGAAVYIRRYLNLIAQAGMIADVEITRNEDDTSKWLGLEQIKEAMGLMETALHEAEASPDENHARRVLRSKASIDYAFLIYPGIEKTKMMSIVSDYSKELSVQEFCRQTIEKTKSDGIHNYREGMNFSMFEFVLKQRHNLNEPDPESVPDFCKELFPADYVILDSDAITGYWLNDTSVGASFRVSDNKSSTGKALKTRGSHGDWNFQFRILPGLLEEGAEYKVYISARCEGPASNGTAFACGVHDPSGYRDSAQETRSVVHRFDVKDNIGQPYKLYDLGTHKLLPEDCIWAGPGSNSGVDWVFVDRFIIVKEKTDR